MEDFLTTSGTKSFSVENITIIGSKRPVNVKCFYDPIYTMRKNTLYVYRVDVELKILDCEIDDPSFPYAATSRFDIHMADLDLKGVFGPNNCIVDDDRVLKTIETMFEGKRLVLQNSNLIITTIAFNLEQYRSMTKK